MQGYFFDIDTATARARSAWRQHTGERLNKNNNKAGTLRHDEPTDTASARVATMKFSLNKNTVCSPTLTQALLCCVGTYAAACDSRHILDSYSEIPLQQIDSYHKQATAWRLILHPPHSTLAHHQETTSKRGTSKLTEHLSLDFSRKLVP